MFYKKNNTNFLGKWKYLTIQVLRYPRGLSLACGSSHRPEYFGISGFLCKLFRYNLNYTHLIEKCNDGNDGSDNRQDDCQDIETVEHSL